MIPSGEVFLAGIQFYVRRHDLPSRFDDAAIVDALAEAERLATDERDEPAALFFACTRRSRAFGGAAGRIIPFVVRSHAASLGITVAIDDLELEILRARVLLGAIDGPANAESRPTPIDFNEIRDRFAATKGG